MEIGGRRANCEDNCEPKTLERSSAHHTLLPSPYQDTIKMIFDQYTNIEPVSPPLALPSKLRRAGSIHLKHFELSLQDDDANNLLMSTNLATNRSTKPTVPDHPKI